MSIEVKIGIDEGQRCNRPLTSIVDGLFSSKPCPGDMHLPPPENCTCFRSAPCGSCMNREVECDVCGAQAVDE